METILEPTTPHTSMSRQLTHPTMPPALIHEKYIFFLVKVRVFRVLFYWLVISEKKISISVGRLASSEFHELESSMPHIDKLQKKLNSWLVQKVISHKPFKLFSLYTFNIMWVYGKWNTQNLLDLCLVFFINRIDLVG